MPNRSTVQAPIRIAGNTMPTPALASPRVAEARRWAMSTTVAMTTPATNPTAPPRDEVSSATAAHKSELPNHSKRCHPTDHTASPRLSGTIIASRLAR